ncbi:MAG: hypothetical protein COA91_10905 [Robiginitomaculum sp.]|nr:MAG: hypothetical protein COA91_10905 [Robiginitomaculum sp.]
MAHRKKSGKKSGKQPQSKREGKHKKSRFQIISDAANAYGERSFDNYAQIRSVAEQIQAGLCVYMGDKNKCVFLVPPQGPFIEKNYGSSAFSVSGKGFLPLEPISFGLGVRVSETGDFLRIVLQCRKEGERIDVQVENSKIYELSLPVKKDALNIVLDGLYQHILNWFNDRVERYDYGNYGTTDIGFDILRIDQ